MRHPHVCGPQLTYTRTLAVHDEMQCISLMDKRAMYQLIRNTPGCNPDTLLPALGLTVGEAVTHQVLALRTDKEREREDPSPPSTPNRTPVKTRKRKWATPSPP